MNFKAITEGVLDRLENRFNVIHMPAIPSEKLDFSEFFTFKVIPSTSDDNVTSPRRTFPFLKGKADRTPSQEDQVEDFLHGEIVTIEHAWLLAHKAVDKVTGKTRVQSAKQAVDTIFNTLKTIPGVIYVQRTGKDITFLFEVDKIFLKKTRINKELHNMDLTGLEDLL